MTMATSVATSCSEHMGSGWPLNSFPTKLPEAVALLIFACESSIVSRSRVCRITSKSFFWVWDCPNKFLQYQNRKTYTCYVFCDVSTKKYNVNQHSVMPTL